MAQLFVQHPFELENKEIRMSEFEIVFIFLIRILKLIISTINETINEPAWVNAITDKAT